MKIKEKFCVSCCPSSWFLKMISVPLLAVSLEVPSVEWDLVGTCVFVVNEFESPLSVALWINSPHECAIYLYSTGRWGWFLFFNPEGFDPKAYLKPWVWWECRNGQIHVLLSGMLAKLEQIPLFCWFSICITVSGLTQGANILNPGLFWACCLPFWKLSNTFRCTSSDKWIYLWTWSLFRASLKEMLKENSLSVYIACKQRIKWKIILWIFN